MRLSIVVGTRPNFIKVAPIIKALNEKSIGFTLVHTGQHYDYEMSKVFFKDLEIPTPDIHLNVGSGTHAEQTGRILMEFEKVLIANPSDLVLVVGDVNSTLASALAAVKLHIPIAHIEAGIRSNDITMPEEVNRLLTDHISTYLFTTSFYDNNNLLKEGIPKKHIYRVGNVMVDSLLSNITKAPSILIPQSYILLTLHRPSNVDNKEMLSNILSTVNAIGMPVVFPAHPRTLKNIKEFGLTPNFNLLSPQGYLDFLSLEKNAKMVITDSGGIQCETTILGVPCLTLLDSPLWPITHEQGTNILIGRDMVKLKDEALHILNSEVSSKPMIELWDGKASERIVDLLIILLQSE